MSARTLLILLTACAQTAQEAAPARKVAESTSTMAPEASDAAGAFAPAAPRPAAAAMEAEEKPADENRMQKDKGRSRDDEAGADGAEDGQAAPTRSWFPETFLFEPLIVTDDAGTATVTARVPDRLTSWRVLALAWSRAGQQAGAVSTFLGTLPVYVDPVVPPFLLSGDQVRLPVQVVNTTDAPLDTRVEVTVSGSGQGAGGGSVHLGPGGSAVVTVPITATGPGTLTLRAAIGADAVERTIEVMPSGRLDEQIRAGTLAGGRSWTLQTPAGLETAGVRVAVFPGAEAVLENELAGCLGRATSAADDAYALLLAGQGPGLLGALGAKVDPDETRNRTLLSMQRALQWNRAPAPTTAALFVEGALAHPDNPVLQRLGERLADTLVQQQRPDGTWAGGDGWTVQRLLVATAEVARAIQVGPDAPSAARQRATRVRIRASGAFERLGGMVQDPYTAASILASGAVGGPRAEALRKIVADAVVTREDGSMVVPAPSDVVRADGSRPTEVETTALAVLALTDAQVRENLAATVLSAYHPAFGWGDGRAALSALRATLAVFKQPVPEGVRVTLTRDGEVVVSEVVDPHQVSVLEAPAGAPGTHTWAVSATPAVGGLGFQLALQSWVPWQDAPERDGLALRLEPPGDLAVGRPGTVRLVAAIPSGQTVAIHQGLPAGMQVDPASLDALVRAGTLLDWDAEDGALNLHARVDTAGQALQLSYRVIPTLAGNLRSGASSLAVADATPALTLAPQVWSVR